VNEASGCGGTVGRRARGRAIAAILSGALVLSLASASAAWGLGELSQSPGASGCTVYSGADLLAGSGPCLKGRAMAGAESIAASPDGRNVYVTSYDSDSVSVFDRGRRGGALTQKPGAAGCIAEDPTKAPGAATCAPGRALNEPTGIVVSADGRNVYVVGNESDSVAIFDRDPKTGALTQKPGAAGCISPAEQGCQGSATVRAPSAIAISPDGTSVYVASLDRINGRDQHDPSGRSISIFDRDPQTGALTQKPGAAGCVSSTATGGACQFARAIGDVFEMAVSPDGRDLYVTSKGPDALVLLARDPSSGALTQLPGKAGCIAEEGGGGACAKDPLMAFPNGIAVSPDGRNVYVASQASAALLSFDRDPATGALRRKPGGAGCVASEVAGTACSPGRGLERPADVAVSPDGRSVYLDGARSNGLAVFDRDGATGGLRQKHGRAGCIAESLGRSCLTGRSLGVPLGLLVSPDGRNVYVASLGAGGVATLDRSR
jgi:DNA-binding beta-propeller fold protein YncE